MKKLNYLMALALLLVASTVRAEEKEEGFITIFDGKSYDGWKINENEKSWSIEDGAFKAKGDRSHLFYVGEHSDLKDFELKIDVMTLKNSNGGIYFHTKFQETGWPDVGHESQVNNTHPDPQKTGGIYNNSRVLEAPAQDGKWWTQHIIVKGQHITVKIDGKTVVDYDEPKEKEGTKKLGHGTIALQAHDPGSTVYFKNIRIKPLK